MFITITIKYRGYCISKIFNAGFYYFVGLVYMKIIVTAGNRE